MKRKVYRKYWNLIFEKVFDEAHMNNASLQETCSKIKRYKKYIQRLKSHHQRMENDYRSGYETYGYESLESIENSLIYISDRFHAGFRLAWLVSVPEEVEKLLNKDK